MRRAAAIFVVSCWAFAGSVSNSSAQLITTPDVDALCRVAPSESHRNTIVYVDLSSIRPGEDEWGYTLLRKLELAPRESLTVLGINPSNFEVLEVFGSCYPTLTKAEMEQVGKGRSVWDKLTMPDPQSQQRDNLQTYDARLRNALDQLVIAARKYVPGKRRDILGAIAVDKNRFTSRDAFYRIIIFTNGTISDDFETGTDEAHIVELLTKKYPTSFAGAEVSIFGVTGGERNDALESKEKIFSSFFLNNWGQIHSFTPSLPQQTSGPFSALISADGTYEGGGIKGVAKLAFVLAKAKPVKIWLTFLVGATSLFIPVDGDYSCGHESCDLKGTVAENIPVLASTPYFRKGDVLALSGKQGEALTGMLSSEAKEVFKDGGGTEEVKYKLQFSRSK